MSYTFTQHLRKQHRKTSARRTEYTWTRPCLFVHNGFVFVIMDFMTFIRSLRSSDKSLCILRSMRKSFPLVSFSIFRRFFFQVQTPFLYALCTLESHVVLFSLLLFEGQSSRFELMQLFIFNFLLLHRVQNCLADIAKHAVRSLSCSAESTPAFLGGPPTLALPALLEVVVLPP